MDNPFESISTAPQAPKVKRVFKFDQMLRFFPEESRNTVELKFRIAEKVKDFQPDIRDINLFRYTQMFFNKYFYGLEFSDEKEIEKILENVSEFEMFKTI